MSMDPELRAAIDELRGQLNSNGDRNAEVVTRLDAIEERATQMATDHTTTAEQVAAVRAQIDELREADEQRATALTDMQQAMRVHREASDPLRTRQNSIEMLGMIGRQMLATHLRSGVPSRFAGEAELVRAYREQRATLEESTGDGAYFIPTILQNEIIDSVEELSDILTRVDLQTGMPTKATIPVFNSRSTLQPKRASSDTEMTASDLGFTEMTYDTDEAYVFFPIDNWLLQLTPLQLGTFVLNKLRESYLAGLANWVMVADGTASYNSITGILSEATYVTSMAGGKTSFADVDNAMLNKVLAAMLKRGRSRASFLMSLYVLGILEDIDRQGKMKIISEGTDGEIRCKRRPVVIDEDMPDEADNAADTGFMAIGDLSAMLVVIAGRGLELATSSEFYFNRNQTCFRATGHIDVQRKPVNILRLLKTAAV